MNEDEKEALAKFRGHLISANKIADEQKWGDIDIINFQRINCNLGYNLGYNIRRIIDMIVDITANAIFLEELADKLEDKFEDKLNG